MWSCWAAAYHRMLPNDPLSLSSSTTQSLIDVSGNSGSSGRERTSIPRTKNRPSRIQARPPQHASVLSIYAQHNYKEMGNRLS